MENPLVAKILEALRREYKGSTLEFKKLNDTLTTICDALQSPPRDLNVGIKGIDLIKIKGAKGDKGLKGDPGDTPKLGVDYYTEKEQEKFRVRCTPVKGTDYFSDAEVKDFLNKTTPKKGVHYFTDEDIKKIILGVKKLIPKAKDGAKGKDGVSPKLPPIKDIAKLVKVSISEKDGKEIVQAINAITDADSKYKIDAKHIKNLKQTVQNFYGGGSSGPSGSTTFIGLSDVPTTYVGQASKGVRVNAGATALEFYTTVDTDEKAGVQADDAAGYLADKVIGGTNITATVGGIAGARTLSLALSGTKTSSFISDFTTAVQNVGDASYSLLGHTHTSSSITDFTEASQDAVGAMVNATLSYVDATPLLGINLANANTWTANITISKALPEMRMITSDNYYTRINRTTGGLTTRLNQSALTGTGYAINLSGANGLTVTTQAALDALTTFTISGWYKYTTASGSAGFLFSKYNGSDALAKVQALRSGSSYQIRMGGIGAANWAGSATIFDNTWKHFVLTYDLASGVLKTYVNNVLDINQTIGGTPYTGAGPLYIGHRAAGNFAVGLVDEFKVYNVAWDATQVSTDYNSGSGVYGVSGSGLVLGLHLDNALTDYSGNSYSTAWQGSSSFIAGKILASGTGGENEVNIWKSQDGTEINEYGITTFGDPNTTVNYDGLSHTFKIGGVTKATIAPNGFFGLGTTSPTAPLTLSAAAGAAAFALQSAGTDILTLNSSGTLAMSSGTFTLSNGLANVMTLAYNGKIAFTVDFTVGAGGAFTTIASGLQVTARTTSTKGLQVFGLASQSADIFEVANSGATPLVNVTAAGRMGVVTGTTSKAARVGGKIKEFYTSVGNIGTGEDDLHTYTTEASLLVNNGEEINGGFGGSFVSSATATRQLKLYFGGTAIFDTGALTLSVSSSWVITFSIIRVSATVVRYRVALSTQGAALSAYTSSGELTGLTLTNTNILKMTGEAAGVGAATDDIVATNGDVFWWPVSV